MTTLLSLGDLHIGSTIAPQKLAEIEVENDETVIREPNRVQRILAGWLDQVLDKAKEVANQDDLIIEIGGDMIDGDMQHGSRQCWGTDQDQANHAIELLRPFVNLASKCYFLLGTPAHVGSVGEFDKQIAKEFGYKARFHHRVEIGQYLFDFAHHCTLPFERRTQEASLERQASLICREYRNKGEPVPDMIIRHHVHRHAVGWTGKTQMVTNYGWKLRDDYLAKRNPLGLYEIGALFINCETLEVSPMKFEGAEDKIQRYERKKKEKTNERNKGRSNKK